MYLFKSVFEAINTFSVQPIDILRYSFEPSAIIINACLEFMHGSLLYSCKCLYDTPNIVTYMILTEVLFGINFCARINDSQAKGWNITRFFLGRVV
jgi:hypothetical protein